MSFHLDTNTVIALQNGRPPLCRERYSRLISAGEDIFISSVVAFELWYGVARSARIVPNTTALRRFINSLGAVLPLSEDTAQTAGELCQRLEAAGTPIGPYDLLIAAHAVRAGATLVTANTREFLRVPGLKLEDWSR